VSSSPLLSVCSELTSPSRGQYGQDLFTLRSTFFQGRPPKSVNMHWRRFAIKDVPLDDSKAFEAWVLQRWREKDDLLEFYMQNGRFPADEGVSAGVNGKEKVKGAGYIETEVRTKSLFEFLQVLFPLMGLGLVVNVLVKIWWMVGRVVGLR
jgi:lysocardiolipin and lysophospholipid acyltransferase